MERRKFVIGLGSLAAGGAAAMGSGAFSIAEADRDVTVKVADDADALLSLSPVDGGNGDYADGGGDTIEVDISDSNDNHDTDDGFDGSGVNPDATTRIYEIFEVKNQGTQDVAVYVDDISPDKYGDYDDGDLTIDPHATDLPNNNDVLEDYDNIGSIPEDDWMVSPGDEISLTNGTEFGEPNPWDLGAVPNTLGPGDSFKVGFRIQTEDDVDTDESHSIDISITADADLAKQPDDLQQQ